MKLYLTATWCHLPQLDHTPPLPAWLPPYTSEHTLP